MDKKLTPEEKSYMLLYQCSSSEEQYKLLLYGVKQDEIEKYLQANPEYLLYPERLIIGEVKGFGFKYEKDFATNLSYNNISLQFKIIDKK